tara:strand:- start:181 stop:468 length:288 start_codon:yes stop_codon:yes gene_type:complete
MIIDGASIAADSSMFYKNREEAKNVAKLIYLLKNDVEDVNHFSNQWYDYVKKGKWEQECTEHFSPNGMLEGRENIFAFFKLFIDYKCDENNYRVV